MTMVFAVQLGPYFLPKGTGVHMNLWAMQHDERYWQDAEAFKPERWLGDKNGGDRSNGLAYMPFGVGPRMCIGIKLARELPVFVLRCTMLITAVAVASCVVLHCALLCCVCNALGCAAMCCAVLSVLCCAVLCCAVLCCAALLCMCLEH